MTARIHRPTRPRRHPSSGAAPRFVAFADQLKQSALFFFNNICDY
jgi:hypothetical protein